MLELNQEYTYKSICQELGWKESSGEQKKKQIREIESSYEFYHPENKKTHKLKKSYIFTKQLKKPELTDKRKNNGATKKIPDSAFLYLFNCMIDSGMKKNFYYQRGRMNDIYVSTSLIYKEFGFDIYQIMNDMSDFFACSGYVRAKKIFQDMCINAVRTQTVTRICKLLGYSANSLPKGILRLEHKESKNTIPDDDLLIEYNIYMEWFLESFKCRSEISAVKTGHYFEIIKGIENEFAVHEQKYGVRRLNKITIESDEFMQGFELDLKKKEILQKGFQRTILNIIWNGIERRRKPERCYKIDLDLDEIKELVNFFIALYDVSGCDDKRILVRAEEMKEEIEQQIREELRKEIEASGV